MIMKTRSFTEIEASIDGGAWNGVFGVLSPERIAEAGDEASLDDRPGRPPLEDCPKQQRTWRTILVMGHDMIVQNVPKDGRLEYHIRAMVQPLAYSGEHRRKGQTIYQRSTWDILGLWLWARGYAS